MSDNPALEALVAFFPSVVKHINKPVFNSHEFILKLAHEHQREYVEVLYSYKENPYPFQVVHGIIMKRLKSSGLVIEDGSENSFDIFQEQEQRVPKWRKL